MCVHIAIRIDGLAAMAFTVIKGLEKSLGRFGLVHITFTLFKSEYQHKGDEETM